MENHIKGKINKPNISVFNRKIGQWERYLPLDENLNLGSSQNKAGLFTYWQQNLPTKLIA